jgi:hypothetical protein
MKSNGEGDGDREGEGEADMIDRYGVRNEHLSPQKLYFHEMRTVP